MLVMHIEGRIVNKIVAELWLLLLLSTTSEGTKIFKAHALDGCVLTKTQMCAEIS